MAKNNWIIFGQSDLREWRLVQWQLRQYVYSTLPYNKVNIFETILLFQVNQVSILKQDLNRFYI